MGYTIGWVLSLFCGSTIGVLSSGTSYTIGFVGFKMFTEPVDLVAVVAASVAV
jgi:hypothetical protein